MKAAPALALVRRASNSSSRATQEKWQFQLLRTAVLERGAFSGRNGRGVVEGESEETQSPA